jgi:transcription elongation factor GreA
LTNPEFDTSKVSILSKVKIKNKKNGTQMTYTLVSEEEADLKKWENIRKVTDWKRGYWVKKVGESTQIKVPAGNIEFEIQAISL